LQRRNKVQEFKWWIIWPIFWGWCPYFFSPADGCVDGPDRKAHGDVPLLEWYISQIAKEKQSSGIQVVDYIDIHYYPQESGVTGNGEDPSTGSLRLRSTRALWDQTYIDESWINAPIYIIPRVKDMITKYLPSLKMGISEYTWGGDSLITGAVANAEVLAIFAREGVDMANRWVVANANTATEDAWSIFLNYDGKGSSILGSYSVSATSDHADEVTSYAFDTGKIVYVLLINKRYDVAVPITVDVSSASASGTVAFYQFAQGQRLKPAGSTSVSAGSFKVTVPEWSATLAVVNY